MAEIADFLDDVRRQVPGAIDSVITLQLQKVVRDFLRRSTRWRLMLPAVNLVANQSAYGIGVDANHLQLPTDSEIFLFNEGATQNGRPLPFWRQDDMWRKGTGWATRVGGQVEVLYATDNTLINCYPIPTDTTYPLLIPVTLITTKTAATCPDFVENDYDDVITAGTVARLKNQVGADWYDPKVAALKDQEYMDGCAEAAIQQDRGFSKRVRRAVPPRMGA